MPSHTGSFMLRYGFAAASIVLATWVRLLLDPVLGLQIPFATLFLAIMLTAWFCGFGPALVAALLGSLASLYLLPPRGEFAIRSFAQWVGMLLYLGTGLGIAFLGGLMKAAQRRAEVSSQAERHEAMLIDQTYDAVFTWDWNGPITFWNRGAERVYGFSRDEALGQLSHTFLHTECPGKTDALVSVLERKGYWEGELEHTTRDGRRITVESRMVLVRQAERPYELEANRDITERRRIEEELRQANDLLETRRRERSEERVRQTVESAPNGMVMSDHEGKIVLVNTQMEKLFGYSRDELLGQTVELLVPERFRTRHSDFRTNFFANSEVRPMGGGRDLYGRRKDGSEFPVEIGLNPIEIEEGLMVLSAIVDITERREAEKAVRESEKRFRALVTASSDVVYCMSPDWSEMRQLLGRGFIADTESPNRAWFQEYIHPDDQPHVMAVINEAIRTKCNFELEHQVRRVDGSLGWTFSRAIPLLDANGEIAEWFGAASDITERKRAEVALRRLNDELKQVVHRLSEANRELKASTQEIEAFVYSVSHDLRSPLVNLQGFSKELGRAMQTLRVDLLESDLPQPVRDRRLGILDGPMAKAIHFIETATTRLSGIIDALLRLSRAGRVVYQRRCVDVQTIVTRVIVSLRGTAEERAATIETGHLPAALGDPAAVEQVFANLIGNALNYLDSKRPGRIEVGSLGPEQDSAGAGLQTYYVRDNGLGISEAGRAKVFQPFQRLSTQAAPGEGMGLAIVHRVVERHGGRIWFESVANQGSTFFVALPAFPHEASPAAPITAACSRTGNQPT